MAGRRKEKGGFYLSPILTLGPRHIETTQLYDRLPCLQPG